MWRGAASAQQQPDRGEHEHLVHHLDVEELVHHLDVGAVNSGHHLAVEELVHHHDTEEILHHLDIEELLHHLDVEELGHNELLRFDEQLRLAVTSLRDLLVSQGGHYLLEWLQMHLLSECRLV